MIIGCWDLFGYCVLVIGYFMLKYYRYYYAAKKRIIIGARGSKLSIIQAKGVISLLKKKIRRLYFRLKKIVTSGDKNKAWRRNDRGIFVKEIEEALLSGK